MAMAPISATGAMRFALSLALTAHVLSAYFVSKRPFTAAYVIIGQYHSTAPRFSLKRLGEFPLRCELFAFVLACGFVRSSEPSAPPAGGFLVPSLLYSHPTCVGPPAEVPFRVVKWAAPALWACSRQWQARSQRTRIAFPLECKSQR